jgi:uncharacterized protein (DUF58 family)
MAFHWIVVYGVLLLAALTWLYQRRALRHVTYERYFSRQAAFEGDTIEMVERIANRKLLPVPWLRLESMLSRHLVFGRQENLGVSSGELLQNHISLFSLRPYRQIVRRHEVHLAKRGWYRLDSVTMTAGEPFGLVRAVRTFPVSLTLLVYPRGVPLRELPLPNHSWLGELPVRRWIVEDPFLAAGVRDYRSGDPLKAVHWKATARTGRLQVHKRDHTADHRLFICLNMEVTETMWKTVTEPERIERGIRYAASVAEYALRNGLETGFLSNGWLAGGKRQPVRIPPAGGAARLTDLLEAMAKLELESAGSMALLLEQEAANGTSNADFLIITCHRGDKLRLAADRLKSLGNGVEWMMIPPQGREQSREPSKQPNREAAHA